MMIDRRLMIAGALALAAPGVAWAEDVAIEHRGWRIDLTPVAADRRAALAASLREQIDLVESLQVRSDVMDWFRSVRITIDPSLNQPGRVERSGLSLRDLPVPAENPVLLHELLHVYQGRRLADGPRNPELVAFYEAARASGRWPARAYMLNNLAEFFAMTASVALSGRAARPPSTREALREAMPDYYAWLVAEFGLRA